MIREVTVLLEDNERIALVATEAFCDWTGPLDMRITQDPYREDYAEVEFKRVNNLKRVVR